MKKITLDDALFYNKYFYEEKAKLLKQFYSLCPDSQVLRYYGKPIDGAVVYDILKCTKPEDLETAKTLVDKIEKDLSYNPF